MFSKLKEKLKNWTKGFSKKAEEEIEEIDVSEEKKETPKKLKKVKEEKKKTLKQKEEFYEEELKVPSPEIEETETITEIIQEDFSKKQKEIITPRNVWTSDSEEQVEEAGGRAGGEEAIEEKKSFFSRLTSKINKVKISEKDFWVYAEDLEMLLIENNVAFEVAEKIIQKLKEKIVDKEFLKKEIEYQINENLKDIIYEILIEPFDLVEKIKLKKASGKPYIILFCGINGTGKTTTIAKISNLLKKNKLNSVLAAGDTFRAASIEQLKKHGEKLGVNVISHEYGSDPASVGYDAIKFAEKNNIDAVLIDTAGRMHTEKNLMSQIEKISRVCNPDAKIFVGESITGNDIIEQVNEFNKSVKLDGIILTKADIDEKGGTALSVGAATGKPILFLGTGQNYSDLEKFDRNKFVESLGL